MPPRHPDFTRAAALIQAGRVPEAALILQTLAAADDVLALNTLAEMRWNGMLPQDPAGARRLFERAAALGYAPAAQRVTNLLASGIAGARDWAGALDRLRGEAAHDPARRRALDLLARMTLDAEGDPAEPPAPTPLSTSPRVVRFGNALSAAECDYLRNLDVRAFRPATVYDAQRRLVRDPIRTSEEMTINWLSEDPATHALMRRLAALSGTRAEQGEAAQILRYQPGQQYRSHFDFLPNAANQRIVTVLLYLNDDYRGGETAFLRTGLKVRAKKGDALLFANTLPDGSRDDMAQHAGLPVDSGTKFLLSRWIRADRWAP